MATAPKIILKKSSVPGNAPDSSGLVYGELAINYNDGRLYYKNSSNIVKSFIDSDLVIQDITNTVDSAYVSSIIKPDTFLFSIYDSDGTTPLLSFRVFDSAY